MAIPDTADGMPTSMRYDEASKQLWIGTGCVGPGEPEVRRYSVSGMNVLDKWFGYRRKEPAGKRLRSLDHECSPTWLPDWTSELLELLNVLGLLVEPEPEQRQLLDEICQGPRITVNDLLTFPFSCRGD
ncbi:type ISP restriction/modification enzyme [Streptomyces sp. NPDC003753]